MLLLLRDKEQKLSGRLTCAVCASPAVVFAQHGLLEPLGAVAQAVRWGDNNSQQWGSPFEFPLYFSRILGVC